MKQGDAFPGSFLKVDDLNGKSVTLTMSGCDLREIGSESTEKKPVLSFAKTEKELVLNKTNFSAIVAATGCEDSDGWLGREVVLAPSRTEFRGQSVPCIRVDVQATRERQPAEQTAGQSLEDDDGIPF